MSVEARAIDRLDGRVKPSDCAGCGGDKGASLVCVVRIYRGAVGVTIALCEECGRDVANAVGFMCVRDGGWSKLEPRKRLARVLREVTAADLTDAEIKAFLACGENSSNVERCCQALLGWNGLRASDADRPKFRARVANAINARARLARKGS